MMMGPSTCPMKMVAAAASAVGPRKPMVREKMKPNALVIHFKIFQCHNRAASVHTTRITGRTRKPKINIAPALVTG